MRSIDTDIVVFFSSQVDGTAEEFANRIAEEAIGYGMKASIVSPIGSNFECVARINDVKKPLLVFCLDLNDQSSLTDKSQAFYDWLKKTRSNLSGINFAIFSLDRKTSRHFNAVAIHVDTRLAELNGNRICELGLGDLDKAIEDDFTAWKKKFWAEVCDKIPSAITSDSDHIPYELVVDRNRLIDGMNYESKVIYTGEPYRIRSSKLNFDTYDETCDQNKSLIDHSWSRKILELVSNKAKLMESYSWLSTVGGGFSCLGEHDTSFSLRAGKLSLGQQLQIAKLLGDDRLKVMCHLFAASAALQMGYIKACTVHIRNVVVPMLEQMPYKDHTLYQMLKHITFRIRNSGHRYEIAWRKLT